MRKNNKDSSIKNISSTTTKETIMPYNHIVKKDGMVHRPAGIWTTQIHKLLDFLHTQNFTCVPKPHGFNEEGHEIVSFIKGEVCDYPLSLAAASDKTLISVAKLLRKFHDHSCYFLNENSLNDEIWYLSPQEPREVICHGDFAPYNIVLQDEEAIGIIDFDTCHPGPRIWDVAYTIYRWAPMKSQDNPDSFGDLAEQVRRARIFCDEYGLNSIERQNLPDVMIKRLSALVNFMLEQAEKDNKIFAQHIEDKHHLQYSKDIENIRNNHDFIIRNI